jgi:hypothetical protein
MRSSRVICAAKGRLVMEKRLSRSRMASDQSSRASQPL